MPMKMLLLMNVTCSEQLREDIRKGVYVENLTEYQVESVNDILKLLIQVHVYLILVFT